MMIQQHHTTQLERIPTVPFADPDSPEGAANVLLDPVPDYPSALALATRARDLYACGVARDKVERELQKMIRSGGRRG